MAEYVTLSKDNCQGEESSYGKIKKLLSTWIKDEQNTPGSFVFIAGNALSLTILLKVGKLFGSSK
jgi:hypothetical protein